MPIAVPRSLFVQFIEQGVKKGLLSNVVRTLDGETYMDFEYLKDFVSKQVEIFGKTNTEKLADILVVEQETIEKAIEELLDTNDWTVIDDLVLTPAYMNDLENKVESQLCASGSISIVMLSQQMKLPYSLLKLVTIDHDGYIRFSQIPDVISTREYIDTCKVKIYQALNTTDEPLAMFKLQKSLNIQEDMFYLLLEHIVKESTFTLGTLRGKKSRALFEPKSYKDGQIALIKSIFDSNECISLNTIENLYPYANATDIIADNYDSTTYFTLISCVIKRSVKEKAKDALESATDFCNLNDYLPAHLTFDDVNKVMDIVISEINTDQKKLIIMEGGYVTTREYIDKTVLKTRDYLLSLARTLKQKNTSESLTAAKMTAGTIVKALESTGCPYAIAEKIVPHTRIAIVNQFADILQTPFIEAEEIVSADKWVLQYKARELATVLNLGKSIYYNYQAIKLFQDVSTHKSLEKFLLKNQCIDFLYHLVIYSILSQSFNKAEVSDSTSLCITIDDIENQNIVDAKQQKYVITYFIRENDHKYDKTCIVEIEEILKKKDISLFISEILIKDKQHLFKESLENSQMKSEANKTIQNHLHNQLEGLQISANSAPQLLHLTTLIFFQKIYQIPLYVSGKFVPVILNEIKSKLEPKQQLLLETAHLSIVNNDRDQHLEDYKQLKMIGMNYK